MKRCLDQGDDLFVKGRLEKSDEIAYGEMNERFHNSIVEALDNSIISDLIARLHRVPFVAPLTIAFDTKAPQQVYDLLHHAHRQHHAITDALENGQGARAEALLKEHVFSQKQSMNLAEHRPGMQHSGLAGMAAGR